MVLKRWGSFMLLLMIILSSCGAADSADVAISDTGVQSTTTPDNPYPVPATEEPVVAATIEPTVEATVEPTVEAMVEPTVEATVKLISVTRIMTLPIEFGNPPLIPIQWSPDDSSILFINPSPSGGANHADIYTFDTTTGTQYRIAEAAVGAKSTSWGYDFNYAHPIWKRECCEILFAQPRGNEEQAIVVADPQGNVISEKDTTPKGSFHISKNGEIIVATNKGIEISSSKKPRTIPAFEQEISSISYTPNNDLLFAYISQDRTQLSVESLDGSSPPIALTIKDLIKKSQIEGVLNSDLRFDEDTLSWSEDGTILGFALNYYDTYEMWLYSTQTQSAYPLHQVESPRTGIFMRVSPQAHYIAYTIINPNAGRSELYIYDIAQNQTFFIGSHLTSRPIWNASGTKLAAFGDYNTLFVYSIEQE